MSSHQPGHKPKDTVMFALSRTQETPSAVVYPTSKAQPLSLLATALLWRRRAKTRNQLARLNERQLQDVGLSLEQRNAEVAKPFWR